MTDHLYYQSPYSWRYASAEMRQIFSETHRRLLWRRIWVALARAQQAVGLVSAAQLADIEAHAEDVNIERALEIERTTRHDLMAEIKAFAEQCEVGGGVIHLGMHKLEENLVGQISTLPGVKDATLLPEIPPTIPEEEGEAGETSEPLAEEMIHIIKVECENSQDALVNIIAFLNERDMNLASLEILEPNLESVFLHLTGKKLRE